MRCSVLRHRWLGPIAGLTLLTAVIAAGCGGGESLEAKRSHCQSLSHQEHAECVSDLRSEEGRPSIEDEVREREAEAKATSKEGPTEAPAEELGGPLGYVGTISINDEEGTAFRDRYEIGQLVYPDEGAPPPEVMEACNLEYQSVTDRSVFAPGEITVSYTEGSFPERLGLDAEGIIQGTDMVMEVVAYQLDGEWLCRQEELESTSYEIEPGETWDIPIWFIAQEALNNSEPRVSAEVENGWHFMFIGPNLTGDWKYSGPGAGECAGYGELYLYNRSGGCESALSAGPSTTARARLGSGPEFTQATPRTMRAEGPAYPPRPSHLALSRQSQAWAERSVRGSGSALLR